jgi:hypothetical protein
LLPNARSGTIATADVNKALATPINQSLAAAHASQVHEQAQRHGMTM